jgi:hypothetical protein
VAELGVEVVEREQAWPPRDLDIYLMLPEGRAASVAAPTRNDAFDAWNEARPRAARAPFLAVEGSCLRVGTVRLPLAGVAMAGPLPGFEHYVLDRSTAETLEHLALAVLRREPALLEGATSTSKTSAVQYLGAALGQPVVRVNLNAQTDTSELLGRYLPDPSATGRAAWRWVDGRVVRAMRDGAWLVLDELNLAEPAILERLNPLVEADPSLVLTEHDGECFGRHGTPIHPNFRVFATMNPASYGGRTALSPAFRDRFLAFRQVPSPSETDLHTMLERLVLGRGANFSLGAHAWTLPAAPPTLPWAGPKRAVTGVLRQLARLWSSLQGLAADGTPDASGREPAVFTRRGLLALVAAVHADTQAKLGLDAALRAALQRYVVARVAGDAERLALAHVLDASLLGPGQWRVGGTLGPPPPPVPPPVPDTDVPFYLHPGGLR